MLIPLDRIINDFDLKIKGIIHIGAHHGQEYWYYINSEIKKMIFFEPVKSNYEQLLKNIPPDVMTFNIALGNGSGEKEMFIEKVNRGMSCSLLEPKYHLEQYPSIIFDNKEIVKIEKLDNIIFDRNFYNMINIDVQGYELEVFKGAEKTLLTIDYIYTEVNFKEMYSGCCLIDGLDYYLSYYGFKRVLTCDYPVTWGDALYIKK